MTRTAGTVGPRLVNSGGDLRVTSVPGDTRFQVLLPMTEPAAPAP